MTIIDLENYTAKGATAELKRKALIVRLTFELSGAPRVKATASSGSRSGDHQMVPTTLVVEYRKTNEQPWEVSALRVYGYPAGEPNGETLLNIYPHDQIKRQRIPAWIRDAVENGIPA